MMKLNASYAKKVPAEENFSSQQYHCQIEVELLDNTPEQIFTNPQNDRLKSFLQKVL